MPTAAAVATLLGIKARTAGGQLPSRQVAALLYTNARQTIEPDWYWTDETEGSSDAWFCGFYCGLQGGLHGCRYRSYVGCAVAVRLIPLVNCSFDPFNPRRQT